MIQSGTAPTTLTAAGPIIKKTASPDKSLMRLSLLNLFLLALVCCLESYVAERYWMTTLLTYIPQHLFIFPTLFLLYCALRRREWRMVSLNLLATAGFFTYFAGYNIPLSAGTVSSGQPLRIMTYNILRGAAGTSKIMREIKSLNPDVICLQETNGINLNLIPEIRRRLPGWYELHAREVATFSRYPIVSHRLHPLPRPTQRAILETQVDVKGSIFSVYNLHFTTLNNSRQSANERPFANVDRSTHARLEQLRILLRATEQDQRPLVVVGDFNTPPRGVIYRRLTQRFHDAFRATGWGNGYTFPNRLPLMRIDYVFTKGEIGVQRCFVPSTQASDHAPVVADITVPHAAY